jgi:hypothetical protein
MTKTEKDKLISIFMYCQTTYEKSALYKTHHLENDRTYHYLDGFQDAYRQMTDDLCHAFPFLENYGGQGCYSPQGGAK